MLRPNQLNFGHFLSRIEPIDDFRNQYAAFIALHRYWLLMMTFDFLLMLCFGERIQVIDRIGFLTHAVSWHFFFTRANAAEFVRQRLSKFMLVWGMTFILIQIWNASTIYLQIPTASEAGFIQILAMTVAATARVWAMFIILMVTFSWVEQRKMIAFSMLATVPITLAGAQVYQELLQPTSLISYFLVTTLTLMVMSRYLSGRLMFENNKLLAVNTKLAEIQSEKKQLAIEVERARISRELHDTLSNTIGAALIHVRSANAMVDRDGTAFRTHLQEAESLLRQELMSVRHVIHALRPSDLEESGLKHAVETLAANELTARGLVIESDYDIRSVMPNHIEHELLQVMREAITNITKHANATFVELYLRETSDAWQLEIHDDGIGGVPDMTALEQTNSYGIRGIYERVRLLGGIINIASAVENGTSIKIDIPK